MTAPTWDDLLADHTFLIPGTSTPTAASGGQRSPEALPLAVSGPKQEASNRGVGLAST